MEADLREVVDDRVVDLDEQPAPRDPLAHQQAAEMPPRDRADRLAVERVERDQPVDAVEELRAEEPLGLLDEMAAQPRLLLAGVAVAGEADRSTRAGSRRGSRS